MLLIGECDVVVDHKSQCIYVPAVLGRWFWHDTKCRPLTITETDKIMSTDLETFMVILQLLFEYLICFFVKSPFLP